MTAKNKLMEPVRDRPRAWNSRNIERLMNRCHENVELSSPSVVKRWNTATGKLSGSDVLRKHFSRNHAFFPKMRQTVPIMEGFYVKGAFLKLNNFGTSFAMMYLVFHRILDFKTGLDFYLGPFFIS